MFAFILSWFKFDDKNKIIENNNKAIVNLKLKLKDLKAKNKMLEESIETKNSELIELKELFENGNKDKLAEHFDNNYLLTKEQNDLVDRLKCASMTRKELSKECLKLLSENEMIYEQLARKTCDCKRVKNLLITCNKRIAEFKSKIKTKNSIIEDLQHYIKDLEQNSVFEIEDEYESIVTKEYNTKEYEQKLIRHLKDEEFNIAKLGLDFEIDVCNKYKLIRPEDLTKKVVEKYKIQHNKKYIAHDVGVDGYKVDINGRILEVWQMKSGNNIYRKNLYTFFVEYQRLKLIDSNIKGILCVKKNNSVDNGLINYLAYLGITLKIEI